MNMASSSFLILHGSMKNPKIGTLPRFDSRTYNKGKKICSSSVLYVTLLASGKPHSVSFLPPSPNRSNPNPNPTSYKTSWGEREGYDSKNKEEGEVESMPAPLLLFLQASNFDWRTRYGFPYVRSILNAQK